MAPLDLLAVLDGLMTAGLILALFLGFALVTELLLSWRHRG